MADCSVSLHPRARHGIELFNLGRYFEAHEELEAAWRDEPGRVRQMYQGILEAGVTYLHIQRGNYDGAIKVYGRSMRWLRDWPEICRNTNIGQLRRDLAAAIGEMRRLGPQRLNEFDPRFFKPIAFVEG